METVSIGKLVMAIVLALNCIHTSVVNRAIEVRTSQIVVEDSETDMLARLIYGEARGCSTTEQAAVVWCVLNRVDEGQGDIKTVVTAPYQFTGYKKGNPVTEEHKSLAIDVVRRWLLEKQGISDVGRVLPKEYLFFSGDGKHNYFRTEYRGGVRWDWSLPSPYGG